MKYTEQTVNGTKFKLQDFDSIRAFNEYLNAAKPNQVFQNTQQSKNGNTRFTGTSTYAEAEQLFDKGWVAAAERISKHVKVQADMQTTMRSKATYSVVGGQASVPRYLQGIPTNMIDRKQVPSKQKIIVLNRDITFYADVSKEAIEAQGIKALQIIQALEHKGYRVKLNAYFLSQSDDEAVAFRVCVKKPEERMSLLKVAFPLAHPSMLRRIAFKWMETHPTMQSSSYRWAYGKPAGHLISKVIPKTEYLLPNFIIETDINKLLGTMGL